MTLLALLRHAETDWSAQKRLQGQTDIALNAAGRLSLGACRVPAEFGRLQVVSSPLLRCMQTAECLHLRNVRAEPRITEMSWGDWEGQSLAQLRDRLGDDMRANEARGMDFQPAGGESPRQVWARVLPWLAEVEAVQAPTLAVSHRGVIRVVFAAATGWDMLGKPPARLDWSCLHLFALGAAGRPTVLRLNVPLHAAPVLAGSA
jgi:probable phosphoglycerate mutase